MSQLPGFCLHEAWNKELSNLIKNNIFPDFSEDVYNIFRDVYSGKSYRNNEKFIYNFCPDRLRHFSYYFQQEEKPSQIEYLGIDIPVYYNYNEDAKKILIVGMDPLRGPIPTNENPYILQKKISLGTPFGFHDMTIQKREKNLYWKFCSGLLHEGYTVCLSDTFKVYFKHNNRVSNKIKQFTNPEQNGHIDVHQEVFAKEVKIFNPNLIVTLGRIPQLWFTNTGSNLGFKDLYEKSRNLDKDILYPSGSKEIPILPLAHLSSRNRQKNRIYNVATNEDLITEYIKYIKEHPCFK